MNLPPYGPIMGCGLHLAHRKPSGFSLYLSPWGNKRDGSLGKTCCPRAQQWAGDTRGSAAAAEVWAGQADPCRDRELGMCCQQEGATTPIQPTVPESPFGNCFIISKRKLSAAHTTGFILAQNWAQESEQWRGKRGLFFSILCQSKHVRSLDSKLLQDEAALQKRSTTKQLVFKRAPFW